MLKDVFEDMDKLAASDTLQEVLNPSILAAEDLPPMGDDLIDVGKDLKLDGEAISAEAMDLEDMEHEFAALERSLKEMRPTGSNLDGKVNVILSEDKLEAYIEIIPHKIGGEPAHIETALTALKKKGIMDVDRDVILKAFKERRFNEKILVAKGIPPTKGEDAYFIYRFGLSEEGSVLKERALPGQLLMVKMPATSGSPGRAVTGEAIPGQLGKPLEVRSGKGVILSEDGNRAYALCPGQVIWEGDRVSVEEVMEIEDNLNPEDGEIDFVGRVVINGDVADKVLVKAQSDIIVTGRVGDATLISGANVKIQQAISGKGEGKITAKGNVEALSIEGMIIEAEGDIFINDFIRKGTISARRVVSGGQINGGSVSARELIEAKILGSESKEKTFLKVDKGGRISCKEAIHPGVELKIGGSTLNIKNRKQALSFEFEGSKIREEPFIKTEFDKEPYIPQEEGTKVESLVPSVVVYSSTLSQAKEKGAELLNLSVGEVDFQEISKAEGVIKIRVFPAGVSGPWEMEPDKETAEFSKSLDTEGYYQLKNMEEGVFLTVFPPKRNGTRVRVESVLKEIESKGFRNVDKSLLKRTVDEALATPVKIAPHQHIPGLDGLAKVEISEDGARAELTILPPKPGGLAITFEDVLEALREKGVVAGIKEDVIRQAIKEGKFGIPITVAEEIPPIPGEASKIEYHFSLAPSGPRFTEDKWGRVDFREFNLIQKVKAGQVLAAKVGPVTPGKPGRRLTGEEIPPPIVEDVKFPVGKNTEVSEDGLELRSTVNGHVLFVNERINVEPLYEIKGDVNLTTGNIDFPGAVDIAGSVEDGFRVRAEGDIQVRGGVGKANLSSGGSIRIGQGIQANHEGKIWAAKDIICKFVHMGDLFARQDIIVNEEVLHSELSAGGSIIVTGKRGVIIGGKTRARNEVRAKVIGCQISTPTIIEVGVPPGIHEQISTLRRLLSEDLKEFERLKFNIMALKRQQETIGLSPEREELLLQLVHNKNMLATRLRSYTQRKEALERDLVGSTGGIVNVLEAIYPGGVIIIRNAIFEVTEKLGPTTFYLEGDQIRQKPYGSRPEQGVA